MREVESGLGPIDILVNNAGIQHRTPLHEFPHEAWSRLVRTNLDSVFFVGQAVARELRADVDVPRVHARRPGPLDAQVTRSWVSHGGEYPAPRSAAAAWWPG